MFIGSRTYVLRNVLVLMMMMIGANVWGQQTGPVGTDYSGTYYIANYNDNNYNSVDNTNNFYLCPASNYFDGDGEGKKKQPFLTTHKPDDDTEKETKPIFTEPIAKWEIEFATTGDDGVDYYYIKFLGSDGNEYYIVHNDQITNNKGRVRVHLQTTKDEDEDKNLFFITQGALGDKKNLNLCPKAGENVDNSGLRSSLNPAKANMNSYSGQNQSSPGSFKRNGTDSQTIYCGGLVGYWTTDDKTGVWYLEDVKCKTPVITYSSETGKVTITSATEGASIYYTTNGDNPTSSSTPYAPFDLTSSITTIKAIAVKSWTDNSDVATVTHVPNPTITLTIPDGGYIYDKTEKEPEVSLKNGETPISSSEYEVSYTDNINAGTATVTISDAEGGDYIVYGSTTFTIAPKALTVTADAKSKGYGDTDPELTYTATELVEGDVLEGTLSRAEGENVGTYAVSQGTLANSNYSINFTGADLTITPKSLGTGGAPAENITIDVDNDGNNYIVTVKQGEITLIQGTDYTWTGSGDEFEYTVTVTGIGNYSGTAQATYVAATPGYYVLHQNGKGYLKVSGAGVNLENDGTFQSGNLFDKGNCIWYITRQGYLQNEYFYLNVGNNKKLYLSVNPVTRWRSEDVTGENTYGKKHLKINDGTQDLYLCNDGSSIALQASPSAYYNACPVEVEEVSWTGTPAADNLTVQSPQLVTYLRAYFTQKIKYNFHNDAGAEVKSTDGKHERRVYATIAYKAGGNKGTDWDIDEAGILYNKKASGDVEFTATYNILPADPVVLAAHPTPATKDIKYKVTQKPLAPIADMDYLLYSISGGDSYRYPYDDGVADGGAVKPDGKGGTDNTSVLRDPDTDKNLQISWKITADDEGFYTFQNSSTNKYLYYDESAHSSSDYGVLRLGETPTGNSAKFRLYKTSDTNYSTCYYIIPYSKLFAVYKSDGLANGLDVALNNKDYTGDTPVISLSKPNANSTWCIYKYEAEYRIREDFTITGPSSAEAVGNYNITSEGWYGRYIKQSPRNGSGQRGLVIKGTYKDNVDYIWTVTGLGNYINISDGTNTDGTWSKTTNGNANNRKLVVNVTSLPVSTTSGVITLKLSGCSAPNTNVKTSSEKTFAFTILGDGAISFTDITSLAGITSSSGAYRLVGGNGSNFAYSDSNKPGITTFSGVLDGNNQTISGLNAPLFDNLSNGTVHNVNLSGVGISNHSGPTGAIAGTADGGSRIYNVGILDGEVGSNGDVCGGLVGKLDGSARVINCFSYATITGGTTVGGIVGNNTYASKSNDMRTMVMNCMFYGDITGGNSKAPIYNGQIITNRSDENGVGNFNYFWAGASYVQGRDINVYNCALSAETRFLQRFEFFRHLLNSNRALAAWWATGSRDKKNEMLKWVLEPSQIGTATPYPILKPFGKYPSVVNIDADHAEDFSADADTKKTQYNQGRKFGTLTINIQDATSGAPSGANITTQSVTPNITDKDPSHFNFNYYKVQLPYYNDVGTKNYTDNKVVTGWKIVSMSKSAGSFTTTSSDATAEVDANGDITLTTPYNFADRNCTAKDIYSETNKRVFSQGAYFDVPEGVSSITIEPYWGKCVYVSDQFPDVVYNQGMSTAANVTTVGGGQRYTNGTAYDINGSSQKVYTTMGNAVTALNPSGSVYDNAIVLVGNVHSLDLSNKTNSKPYTIMSIDLDSDNEPDYSYILRFNNRNRVHPVRIDFLNVIGLGMAQKSKDGTGTYNFGIMQPFGWFECTNTGLFRVTQLEYDYAGQNGNAPRLESPMILQGGVIEQWVTVGGKEAAHKEAKSVTYYHVGGNVWFKEFHIGVHQDKTEDEFISPHPPISVTGGDFDEFYLTGMYNTPNTNYPDNAECYINGGRFGKVAGTGMQGLGNAGGAGVTGGPAETGNIIWQIDNADIDEFYAGGINAAHIATGNIRTVISNSRVDLFCGGPKFGNMTSTKTVVTNATNCTFRTFFGAGYGGNSYNRRYPFNRNDVQDTDWNGWVSSEYTNKYDSNYGGVETRIDYQFIPMSNNNTNVARLYVDYVNFSLATTHDVTSKLTDCTITTSTLGRLELFSQSVGNFYGGGSLGMVTGPVKSTLTNCTVEGNVFGGGYSATLPTVAVMNNSFKTEPHYDSNLGAYLDAELPTTEAYTWEHATEAEFSSKQIDTGKQILYTTENLTGLGAVTGNVTLTIDGNTTLTNGKRMSVSHSVYGGGEESNVEGNTQVNITGGTITENVFGGGKGEADEFSCSKAMIGVNNTGAGADLTTDENKNKGTKVTISNGQVNGNVYGGGEVGRVEWNTQVKIGVGTGNGPFAPVINGSVFGAGKGKETHGYAALVRGNSTVTIQGNAKVRENVYGGGEQATVGRYWVKGINNVDSEGHPISGAPPAPTDMPDEMPYKTMSGGQCTVTIQGSAQIGPESGAASETTGHVFGAGKGVTPNYVHTGATTNWSKRMVDYNSEKHISGEGGNEGQTWDYYVDDKGKKDTRYVWEYFVDDADPTAADYKTGKAKYLEFLQTLALVTGTDVTINGATVKGNVYGGSESGFVQDDTRVTIKGSNCEIGTTTYGNVFGGGRGLDTFAEAGKVKGTTTVAIEAGAVKGNVYGGGELGDVGLIDKTEKEDGKLTYNYHWKQSDGNTANVAENNKITSTNNNTGICTVTISGGTIGTSGTASAEHGNVYGAGRGTDITWWCEKAIAYATNVTITAGTVNGNVYGGGQIGRVEDDGKVTIGTANETESGSKPDIKGDVFGAGAGLATHGYSALLRGNTEVAVQGFAKIGGNVYGGGETASVGRFRVDKGLPKEPQSGGYCTVTIQDNAKIGSSGTENNVYGACKGVNPATISASDRKSMQLVNNKPEGAKGTTWDEYEDEDGNKDERFIWRLYTEAEYPAFLRTLALTSHPHVTIDEDATVYGSVYGGGERGITLGNVDVDITGGTVEQDVYGGGALSDTNTGNWDEDDYVEADVSEGDPVTDLYERSGAGTNDSPYVYTATTDATAVNGKTYYRKGKWADANLTTGKYKTTVNLTGGLIKGDAYGGGLGQKTGFNSATSDIPAVVWGDINVYLGGDKDGATTDPTATTAFDINYDTTTDPLLDDNGYPVTGQYVKVVKSGRVFGCNNLLGSPKGNVTVMVWKTVSLDAQGDPKEKPTKDNTIYEVAAVYGGGNLAPYTATGKKTHVIIHGCDETSIETVYGGGNAAAVPETQVDVYSTYEIGSLFGGGNGKDKYKNDAGWQTNPGANVNGNTNTLIYGGTVHEAYGASNKKGTIYGNVAIDVASSNPENCTLDVAKLVGAGKDADVDGDLILVMECKPDTKIPLVYGGADNANVNGNVELTITSGNFGKVFGGNNEGGAIMGHIKLNIEETGNCQTPITIDELYLGGNQAAYSQYGYYKDGNGNWQPRTSEDDTHAPQPFHEEDPAYNDTDNKFEKYAAPELNVISCTRIGRVYGGGYGSGATLYGDPIVNINMIPGSKASLIDRDGNGSADGNANLLGAIGGRYTNANNEEVDGGIFGGGDGAEVHGNTTVNIGTATTVKMNTEPIHLGEKGTAYLEVTEGGKTVYQVPVKGAYIVSNVFGGGNEANVTGDTHVNICGTQIADQTKENGYTDTSVSHSGTTGFAVSIGNSVYGGGNKADVKGNTFVTFADGYVFNGIFGGGYSGSVGTFTTSTVSTDVNIWGHTAHNGTCIGKPTACENGTGTCYVVVSGGQIGPVEVATQGMNRTAANGGPVPQGWVWGAGCGLVEDPADDPDTHFKTYVNNTDVTIKGNAFILESIIGGGEFGRVLGNTLVKIEGGQIGVGANKVDENNKPIRYTADQWTEAEEAVRAGNASRINTIAAQMPECSHFPYGKNIGTEQNPNWVYDTYDPFADEYKTAKNSDLYPGGSTDNASDGKTWIGCVFAGGSGYMPYKKVDANKEITGYDWVRSAGWVEGDAEVRISGGHILSNVYGGNEYTDVKGTCTVKMSGGTVGVPRTVEQIMGNPLIGYIYGAGKGDPRVHFNKVTNVKDVEIEITGGTVFGSVYGGGEDGHVLRDVTITIGKDDHTGPEIGTWGTSYVDGNVFGGGRGFSGEAYTAGNVAGSVKMDIKGGSILGSVYGGGRMASVGYGLFDAETNNQPTPGYGEMREDTDTEEGFSTQGFFTKGRGHIDITISGGTIGNTYEYIIPKTGAGGNTPNTITETDFTKWTKVAGGDWDKWKSHNNIPKTEFDTTTGRVSHTKGGNVFAGGMGNLYEQNGTTYINMVDWWRLGCVKSTKLTITGGTIKSNVYGGGELGQVVGYHTAKNALNADVNVGTEVIINGGTIGTEIQDGDYTRFIYGSVFGGGYGSLVETIGTTPNISYPKYIAGRVKAGTKVKMTAGRVWASVYGGGEMAAVGESKTLGETLTTGYTGDTHVIVSGGTIGKAPITLSDNSIRYFGGAKMGNVYGGGSGDNNTVRSGHVYGNTNVTISDGTIYHNVYGGGAYGTVGDFIYTTAEESGVQKVSGITGLNTEHTGTGVATVTITGGTIGYDGKENGMVFGSSRGDINAPGKRDDHTAWVYDTHVTIGTSGSNSGPQIRGTVYGSGENGHVFNDTEVTVNSGTIGIYDDTDHTYDITSNNTTYNGADYPYRGNVYGGGCGMDKYYSNPAAETHDGNGQLYNSLAGIVYGNTTVNITGGRVVRNVYGAGAMGSVGKVVSTTTNNVTTTTITSGGLTTINISGGQVGDDGVDDGNVYGAARGDATTDQTDVALAKNTSVNISSNGNIKGSVYGGGETGDVMENTEVNVGAEKQTSGTTVTYVVASGNPIIGGNVYGGGKGIANSFTCSKAMVGVEGDGVTGEGTTASPYELQDGGTTVRIYNGTVGTLNANNTLVEGTGNVYGGGEIARVERNTIVEIGAATGSSAPVIKGSVFGAGAGVETHGYSALVRGTSIVTVQGQAQVKQNVYGGGELASVGRYWVAASQTEADAHHVSIGMPYGLKAGGTSSVIIQGSAIIGTEGNENTGHVYGAGQGVEPENYDYATGTDGVNDYEIDEHKPKRWVGDGYVWFAAKGDYLAYLETLALSAETNVTIGGGTVRGSVFGGSESGFVYRNTDVKIQGGAVNGDAFGGGRGLASFAEAGRVSGNTRLTISSGAVDGNVYGGGNLGDVGTIDKTTQTNYNYIWKNSESNGSNMTSNEYNNAPNNNTITGTNTNTGICTVSISGGTIGLVSTDKPKDHGNVFGAGRGLANTFWCEKAIAFATNVSISGSTTVVNGNVYGGGEVGRVEDDSKVIIGTADGSDEPDIKGSVYGAGAGLETHGYSALVRGNSIVTVQGHASVEHSVYGGGEIASVGKYGLDAQKMPSILKGGGYCNVTIQGNATIADDVFGAGKGVNSHFDKDNTDHSKRSRRMTVYNATDFPEASGPTGTGAWEYYENYPNGYTGTKFVWDYLQTPESYSTYLETLALATHPEVTIDGSASIGGSVFGGGELGLTKGSVIVNIQGGTITEDVYGGGSLANTNTTTTADLDNDGTLEDYTPTTTVNLKGGTINRNVYGGGLGQLAQEAKAAVLYTEDDAEVKAGTKNVGDVKTPAVAAVTAIEAKVLGEVMVELNKPTNANDDTTYGDCEVKGNIFGCNNMNGSPQKDVTVHVYKTVRKYEGEVQNKEKSTYELKAVYGGGNLAAYYPEDETARASAVAKVIIDGCDLTSIKQVYGGGNAASVPASNITINATYEIEEVFGGGNGKDDVSYDGGTTYVTNPGANVGYVAYGTEYDIPKSSKEERTALFSYGSGQASVTIYDGLIHRVFGGSNKKGNVRESAVTLLDDQNGCHFQVDEAYGGGKNAPMDAEAKLLMACIPGLKVAYGGAQEADVLGGVTLTITNGTYERVFGGNNISGTIQGPIVVNIEETGCRPVIIGELYGGGNQAAYSVYGYKMVNGELKPRESSSDGDAIAGTPYADPVVNVKSFTSIGTIYGGGYGETAVMVGNPTVNIDVFKGQYADDEDNVINKNAKVVGSTVKYSGDGYDTGFPVPSHDKGAIGAIGTVFGGGNAAKVIGTPTVNIGTRVGEQIDLLSMPVEDSNGKTSSEAGWIPTYQKETVLGADIRGDVYGAGNNAEVTGDTKVQIGKKIETSTTPDPDPTPGP